MSRRLRHVPSPLQLEYPSEFASQLPELLDSSAKWDNFVLRCSFGLAAYTSNMRELSDVMPQHREAFYFVAVTVGKAMEANRDEEAILIDNILFSMAAHLPLPDIFTQDAI